MIKLNEDESISARVNKWRSERNLYEYNPLMKPSNNICAQAIREIDRGELNGKRRYYRNGMKGICKAIWRARP
ncbi:MAG: hypothetical protein ACE5J3_14745 [Methanosarcinales archaeon]